MELRDFNQHIYSARFLPFVQRTFETLNPGVTYVDGYYLRAMGRALARVERGECKRLIIALPPRHLKSVMASVALPAWMLGRDPRRKILCISYSSDLAQDFSRQCRTVMQQAWYRTVFPRTLISPQKDSVSEFHTIGGGRRIATGVGGTLTGKGGDVVIIDDPMKAEDVHSEAKREAVHTWFRNTLASRLDDPSKGSMILVSQRLHEDDLIGRLIQTGSWELLSLPAIATEQQTLDLGDGMEWARQPGELLHPERLTQADLDRIKAELGTDAFEAQYQQRPALPGGNLIKLEWFGRYEGNPRPSTYEAIVQSWDTAAVPGHTNDWSVCTTWGLLGTHIDLLDVHRAQHDFPDLVRTAKTLQQKWKPLLIVVEKASSGIQLGQQLWNDGFREFVQALNPEGDKVGRMAAQSPQLEQGQVRLPAKAIWRDAFLSECAAFPNGKHDDQVDTLSQLLRTLDRRPRQLRGISRYKGTAIRSGP